MMVWLSTPPLDPLMTLRTLSGAVWAFLPSGLAFLVAFLEGATAYFLVAGLALAGFLGT
jgi:hypothetical protein